MAEKITELARRLRPFLGKLSTRVITQILNAAEGPGIDIPPDTNTIGLGGDTILLYKSNGDPVAEYAFTEAGMTAALAAATSGDVIWMPAGILGGNWIIPASVTVMSFGKKTALQSILTGTITLSAGSTLQNITVNPTFNSASSCSGVIGPATGTAYIYDCVIAAANSGGGNAIGVEVDDGDLWIWNSYIMGSASGGGEGYAIGPDIGNCFVEGGYVYGSTDEFGPVGGGEGWSAGSEISTGTITVTDSAGAIISGLTPGNKYAVEAYNGPWDRDGVGGNYGDEYDYRLSNDGGSSWSTGYLGENFTGVMHLDKPAWVDYAEVVATHYARCYFIATATSIKIRVGEDAQWFDNIGTLSWRLRSATFTPGQNNITVHAVRGGQDGVPLLGDRSVWDTIDYADFHAKDIAQSKFKHHVPTPNIEGFIAGIVNDGGELIWTELDPADMAVGSGHIIMDEGVALTQRANLDFVGAGVTASDDEGNNKTIVTIQGGPIANHDHSGDAGDGGTFDAANLTSGVSGDGQVLTSDGSGGAAWEDAPAGTGGALDDLTDVNAPTPSDGDVLTYDDGSGEWINSAPTGGGGALDDLTDVNASSPNDNALLRFDSGSGDWVDIPPEFVEFAEQSSAPSTPASGYGRLYVKNDGMIYFKSDDGYEFDLTMGCFPLDIPPISAHAKDDDFPGSSLNAKWTNPVTSTRTLTLTVEKGYVVFEPSEAGTGSTGVRGGWGIRQDAPTGSFTISARIVNAIGAAGGDGGRVGIFVARTASNLAYLLGGYSSGNYGLIKDVLNYSETADWTYNSGEITASTAMIGLWYRIVWDSSAGTLSFYYSGNGYTWSLLETTAGVSQPDRIGLAMWTQEADLKADHKEYCLWFRVTEP